MRRFSLPLVIIGCIALAALLAWVAVSGSFGGRRAAPVQRAPEPAVTQPLAAFRAVDIAGSAEVMLVQGDSESVALPADARASGLVTAEVRDGTLYVESTDHSRWWEMMFGNRDDRTPIVVTLKNVDAVVAAGTVKLTAARLHGDILRISGAGGTALRIDDLQVRELHLVGAGALRADVAGRAATADVTISGAGEFKGAKLVAQNATVTVTGAGKVTINAEKTLTATISGAGSVEFLGEPAVTEHVSGAGRVKRRDAASETTRVAAMPGVLGGGTTRLQ